MFLSLLIEELCTKKENNKADCTLTFGGQCIKKKQKQKKKTIYFYISRSISFTLRFKNVDFVLKT